MTDLDKLERAAKVLGLNSYPDMADAVREAIAELREYREDEDDDMDDDLDDDDFDEDEGE
jgi:Arc/MetJ-type ribon-helix-helix transcriptional regulator